MQTQLDAFEQLAKKTYERFKSFAGSYYYRFRRPSVTGGGVPCMVFLGNHSSGKSTLINWLLGGDPVQDVGLAPTDDKFTVIMYGDAEEDVCGPAALARLPDEFAEFKLFGGNFLQRLRVKLRRRDLLQPVVDQELAEQRCQQQDQENRRERNQHVHVLLSDHREVDVLLRRHMAAGALAARRCAFLFLIVCHDSTSLTVGAGSFQRDPDRLQQRIVLLHCLLSGK